MECEILGEKPKLIDPVFYFNDLLLEQVATLLSIGETKQNVCSKLGITRTRLDREIERLKVMYSDKR